MVRYLFVQMAPDDRVAYAASCTVPYSEAALRHVDRHFGVEQGGGADQFVVRQGMLTTQTCVEDENTGLCVFDPLVVTAPPRENVDPCVARPLECTLKRTDAPDDGGWSDPNDPWSGGGGTDPNNGEKEEEEEEGVVAFGLCVAIRMGATGWGALFSTGVSVYLAWDARQNTKAKYGAWARYRQDVDGGFVRYDIHINDLYYNAWKDAEHQEVLFYTTTATAAGVAGLEIFRAAVSCSPYLLAGPV